MATTVLASESGGQASFIPPPGSPYVKVSDTKPNQTPGGTFTQGAYRTRVINTEDSDTDNICSISSNQITLAAGTYDCLIMCPSAAVLQNKAKLYNVTGAADLLIGTLALSDGTAGGISVIRGRFTVAAGQALEIQHICRQTYATYGFGAGDTGVLVGSGSEVYTVAEFWKVG